MSTVEARKMPAFYRSDYSGESWKQVNADRRIGGRGPGAAASRYAGQSEIIYVANTTTWKSTDGGKTFVASKARPAAMITAPLDQHGNPQIIALSSDQGASSA